MTEGIESFEREANRIGFDFERYYISRIFLNEVLQGYVRVTWSEAGFYYWKLWGRLSSDKDQKKDQPPYENGGTYLGGSDWGKERFTDVKTCLAAGEAFAVKFFSEKAKR